MKKRNLGYISFFFISTFWFLIWSTYFKIPSVEIFDLYWPKDTNDIQKMFGVPDKIEKNLDYLIRNRFEDEIDFGKSENYLYNSQMDTWNVECIFILENKILRGISIAIFKHVPQTNKKDAPNISLNNFVKKCSSVVLDIDKAITLNQVGYKKTLIKPSTIYGGSSNAGLLVKDKGKNFSREFILPNFVINDQFEINLSVKGLNVD